MTFSQPIAASKSQLVFLKSEDLAEELAQTIRATNSVNNCANVLRNCLLEFDFQLGDKFCDSADLEEAWNQIKIPEPLLHFFSVLFNFDIKSYSNEAEDGEEDCFNDDNNNFSDKYSDKMSKSRRTKILSLFQIMYYILYNGRRRTPMHLMNAQAIYETSKNSTVIKSLNHLGLCMSYDEILRHHNNMATYTVNASRGKVPLPSHFSKQLFTNAAFDNFDHEEATLSGINGTHDTVSVLFQEKPLIPNKKPYLSDTEVIHGSKVFMAELPCQSIQDYVKPAIKPSIPHTYTVSENQYEISSVKYNNIKKLDMAWSLSRLNITGGEDNLLHMDTPEEQNMPSWSAFNSLVSEESLCVKQVGFLPVIPYPVTEYRTVYTALKNFQEVLQQLDQTNLPIACDEGVYHIVREIMLSTNEFDSFVPCLGSFHMIKVALSSIGKFLRGSGAETIWTECSIFGINIVESVLNGSNYVRSLKGMFLLSESMDRLRWEAFFRSTEIQNYHPALAILSNLKSALGLKNRVQAKQHLHSFNLQSEKLCSDFKQFIEELCNKCETAKYWNTFIEMVSLIKDLIRADREGDWELHLYTVQRLLPLFAIFDKVNYLRWASLYLEDMRRLPETHPEVHRQFMEGNFVVKRTAGLFKAIAVDLALEQTINRSQKSSSGIIGSTKSKKYVAEWELIYHEMLSISNLHRELTGVSNSYYQLSTNHEFTAAQTKSDEERIITILSYIQDYKNPFLPASKDTKLHNIFTQEIMTNEIRSDMLNFNQKSKDIY